MVVFTDKMPTNDNHAVLVYAMLQIMIDCDSQKLECIT